MKTENYAFIIAAIQGVTEVVTKHQEDTGANDLLLASIALEWVESELFDQWENARLIST